MGNNDKIILWFREVSREDLAVVGGKGGNLGEMTKAGFQVPPGFLVTTKAYFDFINKAGIRDKIEEILKNTDVDNSESLRINTNKIQEIIKNAPIPSYIVQEIEKAYSALAMFGQDSVGLPHTIVTSVKRELPFVAVRSSASAEDLPEASFAGQQSTFLNVKGSEDVVKYVRESWASLFTARATFYREKNNFEHMDVGLCSIVQKMVDSDVSGVGFSINPATNDKDEIIIEGSYGLGEAIVSGSVSPDLYIVDKSTMQIKSKEIKEKKVMIKKDQITGKTQKYQVPESKSKEQCLSDKEIMELARIIKKLEEYYKFPQDMEWAFERGKLYVLQTRPVTTMKDKSETQQGEKVEGKEILKGLGSSPGFATGKVKLVYNLEDLQKIEQGDILVTDMTNPDMVPGMRKAAAIVTNEGGMTAHASIVSRELGIPCVVGTERGTELLKDNQEVSVDAYTGTVYEGKVKKELLESTEKGKEKEVKEFYETKTKVYMNLSIPDIINKYKDLFFEGIGLMRVEFVIASNIKAHPLELIKNNQSDVYINKLVESITHVASTIGNEKPLIVRLSDFKTNEYRDLPGGEQYEPEERNPMIGWRGVSRYTSPEFEGVFRLECRAIKKAREQNKNVHVMLPFVRNVNEVRKVSKIMEEEGLKRNEGFRVYIMAEVPSVIFLIRELSDYCDGFSIGSNDLTQLLLGVDRDSELLSKMGYFNENNVAVKRAISRIIEEAHKYGKTVGICGQAPSEYPDFAEFLVEEGIDSISVNPDTVNFTRKLIHDIEESM